MRKFKLVGFVVRVLVGSHGIALDGDGVASVRTRLDLLGRGDVQKLAAPEMGGEQRLDLPAEAGVLAASLVQISGSGGRIGQVQGGEKDLFFGHGNLR